MSTATVTIDGRRIEVTAEQTILDVARKAGLDIPTLCYLEKCGPLNTCQVCLVKLNGKLVPSCGTIAEPGMTIESETEEVYEARRTALELLFSDHVGDCLAPCQRLCPLGLNIPGLLRQVQSQDTPGAIQTVRATLPLAGVLGVLCHHPCEQGCRRGHWDGPATIRDIERHVAELEDDRMFAGIQKECEPGRPSLAIIGAGPSGLAAAFYLARAGTAVTVFDRNKEPGGTLRMEQLPAGILAREISILQRLGVKIETGIELGSGVSLTDLLAKFGAVLVAIGDPVGQTALGLPLSSGRIQVDPHTHLTPLKNVFATGAAVRSTRQLVRVMAEAKAAADCLRDHLKGIAPKALQRPFSSVMGRLSPLELKHFISVNNAAAATTPCNRCASTGKSDPAGHGHPTPALQTLFTPLQATTEASRCLHCDCASSGNCILQHYAQLYNADANRFRSERRPFECQVMPGGIIFEPGKCILCGICVKITELAAEPLGLTFIGRGFDVKLAAPLNQTIEDGLRKCAKECVDNCPTGALSMR